MALRQVMNFQIDENTDVQQLGALMAMEALIVQILARSPDRDIIIERTLTLGDGLEDETDVETARAQALGTAIRHTTERIGAAARLVSDRLAR